MIRITVLSDNKVISLRPKGVKSEWGFSALVEIDGYPPFMLDAGQTGIAFENLLILKRPFPEAIVLSHGHYDHTGGLLPFLNYAKKIYAHPDAFYPRFYQGINIGIPFLKETLSEKVKIVEHREPVEVFEGVWALGEIPRKYEVCLVKGAQIYKNGKIEDDEIRDDQALVIKSEKGGILILGCCHSGLRNTILWAEEVIGQKVKYIIGGTHLIALSEEEIKSLIPSLEIELLAACHCTGLEREFLLSQLLGEKFKFVGSGSVIEIG